MEKVNLTFYVKKEKIKANGQIPIYVRIRINGKITSFTTSLWIAEGRWKEIKKISKPRKPEDVKLLDTLSLIRAQIEVKKSEITASGMELNVENLKNAFLGKIPKPQVQTKSLMEAYELHNEKFQIQINNGNRAKASLTKFKTVQKHLKDFIECKYNATDILLDKLNYEFIDRFDSFLRSNKNIKNNTTVKYIQSVSTIINLAIEYEWILKNPFLKYKGKLKTSSVIHLTEQELNRIEKKVFSSERLNIVKDIFLFSCYTSYGPTDVKNLTRDNFVKHVDKEFWIFTQRQKTKVDSNILLLQKPLEIIEKYKNHPECIMRKSLLPIRSNQKLNEYLKEIAEICGIKKKLTCYVARHTFACWALENGVPLEVVSRIMGHKRISQTQHYGKLKDSRVSEEMLKLKEKVQRKEQINKKFVPDISSILLN